MSEYIIRIILNVTDRISFMKTLVEIQICKVVRKFGKGNEK